MLLASCGSKTRHFDAEDGKVHATVDDRNGQWQFTDADGNPLVADYDSLRVVELGPEGHPMTVCFYRGNSVRWLQFFSNMQVRSDGTMIDGVRQGLWTFYFPNGLKQTEYAFVDGLEEGPYKVYRENGAPYYIGQCHKGKRVGTWEIYDADGNLAGKNEYGD